MLLPLMTLATPPLPLAGRTARRLTPHTADTPRAARHSALRGVAACDRCRRCATNAGTAVAALQRLL